MQGVVQELKRLTEKKYIKLTESGNHAIFLCLNLAKRLGKKTVLIQDQGGWLSYKHYAKKTKLKIVEVKTDHGIVDLDDLKSKINKDVIFLVNSLAGYIAEQPMKEIEKICKNTLLINDACGSIGTEIAKIGDLVFGSFGMWKPVTIGRGGFIATNEKKYFDFFEKEFKTRLRLNYEELYEKLKNLQKRLEFFNKIREKIKNDLKDLEIVHRDKKGINVVVKYRDDKEKQKIIKYCKDNKLEFTFCPRYIRVYEKAISIEVKRCL